MNEEGSLSIGLHPHRDSRQGGCQYDCTHPGLPRAAVPAVSRLHPIAPASSWFPPLLRGNFQRSMTASSVRESSQEELDIGWP